MTRDKPKDRFLDNAAALLAAILFASLLSPWLHGVAWVFELPGHFKAHLAVAAALLGGFALTRRLPVTAVISLITAGSSWLAIASVPTAPQADSGGSAVVSQNLSRWNQRVSEAVSMLDGEDADLVILQEYTPAWHESLERLTVRYPYAVTVPQDGAFGIALFSRVPIAGHRILRVGEANTPFIIAEFDTPLLKMHLIAVHFAAPMTAVWTGDRNRQLAELASVVEALCGACVLVGDFNNTPSAPTFRRFMNRTGMKLAGPRWLPTWPADLGPVGIPIDFALGTDDVRFGARSTLAPIGSDHRGFRFTVDARPASGD